MFIRIMLNHKNCWSQILSKSSNIYGFLLQQKSFTNYIAGNVAFYSPHKDADWELFFKNLKQEVSVKNVEHIESYNKSKIFIVKFLNSTKNSVTSVIEKYDVPFYREIFYRGFEIWDLFFWDTNREELIKSIENVADMVSYTELDKINFPNPFIDEDVIANLNLLNYAIERGYYSQNKNANLSEIAKTFQISKSNVSRKLRKIEINTINYYISTHIQNIELDKLFNNIQATKINQ